MKIDKTYDYDCSAGNATIDTFEVPINTKNVTMQVFYTGLNASDSEIELLQSQALGRFDYIKDPAGNRAKIAMVHTDNSVTINVVDIVTTKLKVTWAAGSVNAGTIERIIYQFK